VNVPRPILIVDDDPAMLDLRMPVMDGVRFRELQRQSERFARIPTVLLSADPAVGEASQRLDVRDCLRKPVSLDDLLSVVRRNMNGSPPPTGA
jgi:CheY-like chemotaxis protein